MILLASGEALLAAEKVHGVHLDRTVQKPHVDEPALGAKAGQRFGHAPRRVGRAEDHVGATCGEERLAQVPLGDDDIARPQIDSVHPAGSGSGTTLISQGLLVRVDDRSTHRNPPA